MVGALARLGIRRVRLTGGEPLLRRDILEIARRMKALPGIENLALSTNGTELERLAPALKEAGRRPRQRQPRQPGPRALPRDHPPRRPRARSGAASRRRSRPGSTRSSSTPCCCAEQPGRRRPPGRARPSTGPLSVRFIEMMPTATNQHLAAGASRLLRRRPRPHRGALRAARAGRRAGPRTGPAKAFRFAGAAGDGRFHHPALPHLLRRVQPPAPDRPRRAPPLPLRRPRLPPPPLLAAPDPDAALETEILRVLQEKPAEHMLTQGNYGNLVSFMQIGGWGRGFRTFSRKCVRSAPHFPSL